MDIKEPERINMAYFTLFPSWPSNYLIPSSNEAINSCLTTSFDIGMMGMDWPRLLACFSGAE
jgi:hypothetical protein